MRTTRPLDHTEHGGGRQYKGSYFLTRWRHVYSNITGILQCDLRGNMCAATCLKKIRRRCDHVGIRTTEPLTSLCPWHSCCTFSYLPSLVSYVISVSNRSFSTSFFPHSKIKKRLWPRNAQDTCRDPPGMVVQYVSAWQTSRVKIRKHLCP